MVENPGLVFPLPKLFTKAIWPPLPTVRNKGLSRRVFATPRTAAAAKVRQVHTTLAAASPQCHGAAAEARKGTRWHPNAPRQPSCSQALFAKPIQ